MRITERAHEAVRTAVKEGEEVVRRAVGLARGVFLEADVLGAVRMVGHAAIHSVALRIPAAV